jgi:hypothetical protein
MYVKPNDALEMAVRVAAHGKRSGVKEGNPYNVNLKFPTDKTRNGHIGITRCHRDRPIGEATIYVVWNTDTPPFSAYQCDFFEKTVAWCIIATVLRKRKFQLLESPALSDLCDRQFAAAVDIIVNGTLQVEWGAKNLGPPFSDPWGIRRYGKRPGTFTKFGNPHRAPCIGEVHLSRCNERGHCEILVGWRDPHIPEVPHYTQPQGPESCFHYERNSLEWDVCKVLLQWRDASFDLTHDDEVVPYTDEEAATLGKINSPGSLADPRERARRHQMIQRGLENHDE